MSDSGAEETTEVEQCPECGSSAVTTKGVSIDGAALVKKNWDYCLNCGWDNK
jgi:predicted nucleic-acid-binding Zn-ribbon protein